MVLSRFYHELKIADNCNAIFNSLVMKVLLISDVELSLVHNPQAIVSEEFYKALTTAGVFVENSSVDEEALNILRSEYQQTQGKIELLYLIVTQGCNLGCKYCFLENEYANWKPQVMTEETALRAVDKFIAYVKAEKIKKPLIVFFGGEPLLNWNLIKIVVEHCNLYNLHTVEDEQVRFSVITNATLINDDIAEFMCKNRIGIAVSIDGPKKLNDKNRVYKSGEQSVYDKVQDAISILEQHSCTFGLSITLSKELMEYKEELVPWLKTMNVANIFTNLFHYSEYDQTWESHSQLSAKVVTDTFESLATHKIFNGRPMRQIESLVTGKLKFSDCAGVGLNQLTIKPDGEVRVCQCDYYFDDNHIGNILVDDIASILKKANVERWINKAPIMRDECLQCEALFSCGGGCLTQSKILFKSGEIDHSYCIYSKAMLKWMLESYLTRE